MVESYLIEIIMKILKHKIFWKFDKIAICYAFRFVYLVIETCHKGLWGCINGSFHSLLIFNCSFAFHALRLLGTHWVLIVTLSASRADSSFGFLHMLSATEGLLHYWTCCRSSILTLLWHFWFCWVHEYSHFVHIFFYLYSLHDIHLLWLKFFSVLDIVYKYYQNIPLCVKQTWTGK